MKKSIITFFVAILSSGCVTALVTESRDDCRNRERDQPCLDIVEAVKADVEIIKMVADELKPEKKLQPLQVWREQEVFCEPPNTAKVCTESRGCFCEAVGQ